MGSFNVSCGLSNLTIEVGDEAVFIPLKRQQSTGSEFHKFYVYPTDEYAQNLPAIFGVYDDYGYLKDVKDTVGARLITGEFSISPEQFVKCIGNYGRSIYDPNGPVYDTFTHTIPKMDYTHRTILDHTRHLLTGLGFREVENNTFIYDKYKNEQLSITVVMEKNLWVATHTNNVRNTNLRYEVKVFSSIDVRDALEQVAQRFVFLPGFQKEDWSAILKLRKMHGMYIHGEVYTKMMNFPVDDFFKRRENIETKLRQAEKEFLHLDTLSKDNTLEFARAFSLTMESLRSSLMLHDAFAFPLSGCYQYRKYGDVTAAVVEMFTLYQLMQNVNRMFAPGVNSNLDYNNKVKARLATLTNEIIAERNDL